MARFGQGMIQSMINPQWSQGLHQVGMLAGGLPGARRAEEQQRLEEQQKQAAIMSAFQTGQAPGGSDPAAAMAAMAQGVPGLDPKEMISAHMAGASMADLAAKKENAQAAAEAQQGFKQTIAGALRAKGQEGLANVVERVPDFNALPAEAQKRILAQAGITDPDEQAKAMSPQGKLAMDMGFKPQTPEFQDKVSQLATLERAGTPTEAFNSVHSAVKSVADLGRNQKILDAVTALEVRGAAGAEALQENTIIDLFGTRLRAEASVRRFAQSASLPRRIADGLVLWASGDKTDLTYEERRAIVYAASKMQESQLDNAVSSAGTALSIEGEKLPAIRAIYSYPKEVQEWQRRFEEQNFTSKEETSDRAEYWRKKAAGVTP